VDRDGCTLLSTIILKGVNFANNADDLSGEAMAVLDEAVETLKRYPGIKVEIAGHTDSNNSDEYNMDLSERRAKAVRDYFMSRVIPADTLTAKGYGESQPIADNSTEEGRAANRRVELRLLD
jgi:outer membrane protein OmpA-like peptidoglycan-associated protein